VNKEQKQAIVQDMAQRLNRAAALVLTNFSGLGVEDMTDLRQRLRAKGYEYVVIKNTLLKLAARDTDARRLNDSLAGPNGLGISYGDPVDLAKLLVEFAKNNNKLEIRGGLLAGKPINAEAVAALAKLPGREILIAMLLGAMNGIPRNLVGIMAAVPRSLLYALKAIEAQKNN
jgi:large subunit ribosomal protein L10